MWSAFARRFNRVARKSALSKSEESEVLQMQESVIKRYRELVKGAREKDVPETMTRSVNALAGCESLISLSDIQFRALKAAVRQADGELDRWLERARRRELYVAGLEKNRKSLWGLMILTPVLFGVLVALLMWFGFQILNR